MRETPALRQPANTAQSPFLLTPLSVQIVFAAYNAEQWGRVGSRRWLQEVGSFTCLANVSAAASATGAAFCASPLRYDLTFTAIRPSDIAYVIAVDQVGQADAGQLYVHEVDRLGGVSLPISPILTALGAAGPIPVQPSSATAMPPSPVTTFMDYVPALSVDMAVLTGYNAAFVNKYYNSRFDNASNVDAATITSAATLLARTLYALALNAGSVGAAIAGVPLSLAANASYASSLLDCITVNAQCAQFAQILGVSASYMQQMTPAAPLSLYTNVYMQPYMVGDNNYVLPPSLISAVVRNALAWSTSANRTLVACQSESDCNALGASFECMRGACIATTSYYHDALSPALTTSNVYGAYTIDESQASAMDPVWTEPYWSASVGVTLFRKDRAAVNIAVLVIGLALLALSIPAAWVLVRHLDKHYKVP
ncbi:hypothetical protein EON66_00905 [archaeon]|nr:MAG: hypothetical protein EON66_00905 [archaeon]